MPGRTDNAIKNRWNSTMRRVSRQRMQAGLAPDPEGLATGKKSKKLGPPTHTMLAAMAAADKELLYRYCTGIIEAHPDQMVMLPSSAGKKRKKEEGTGKDEKGSIEPPPKKRKAPSKAAEDASTFGSSSLLEAADHLAGKGWADEQATLKFATEEGIKGNGKELLMMDINADGEDRDRVLLEAVRDGRGGTPRAGPTDPIRSPGANPKHFSSLQADSNGRMGRFILPQLFDFDPPTLDDPDEPSGGREAAAGGEDIDTTSGAALPNGGVKVEKEDTPNSSKSQHHKNLKIRVSSPTGTSSGFPSDSVDTSHSYMGGSITPLSSAGLAMPSMPHMSPAPNSVSIKMSPRMGELHSPNASFKEFLDFLQSPSVRKPGASTSGGLFDNLLRQFTPIASKGEQSNTSSSLKGPSTPLATTSTSSVMKAPVPRSTKARDSNHSSSSSSSDGAEFLSPTSSSSSSTSSVKVERNTTTTTTTSSTSSSSSSTSSRPGKYDNRRSDTTKFSSSSNSSSGSSDNFSDLLPDTPKDKEFGRRNLSLEISHASDVCSPGQAIQDLDDDLEESRSPRLGQDEELIHSAGDLMTLASPSPHSQFSLIAPTSTPFNHHFTPSVMGALTPTASPYPREDKNHFLSPFSFDTSSHSPPAVRLSPQTPASEKCKPGEWDALKDTPRSSAARGVPERPSLQPFAMPGIAELPPALAAAAATARAGGHGVGGDSSQAALMRTLGSVMTNMANMPADKKQATFAHMADMPEHAGLDMNKFSTFLASLNQTLGVPKV
jgi:hypothetical protein